MLHRVGGQFVADILGLPVINSLRVKGLKEESERVWTSIMWFRRGKSGGFL
jgi:hypothetical protein